MGALNLLLFPSSFIYHQRRTPVRDAALMAFEGLGEMR
jgi:hypothetical protein